MDGEAEQVSVLGSVADTRTVPPLARKPVFAIAGVVGAILLATSWNYGYFGDELYFLSAGKYHLSLGYADQPWLLPLLAEAIDTVFPGSLVALRMPSMILVVLGVVVTALIAREFGGGKRAQVLACGAYAISPAFLGSGHTLATATVDQFAWTLVIWLVVRWVRLRQDRLLLVAGIVTAIDLQAKFLIAFLWVALAAAVLVTGPRKLLSRPALWASGAIAVAVTVPTLIWQASHGWPYLRAQEFVGGQAELLGGRLTFVPLSVLFAGALVGAFLVCHGVWQLVRSAELAQYRFLGWTIVLLTAVFLIVGGKYYYVYGFYGVAFAASAVRIERGGTARWWRWVPSWPVYALSALLAIVMSLPVFPKSAVNEFSFVSIRSIGWPELADTVVQSYQDLSPTARTDSVVLTQMAWQASALEYYAENELPDVYSPQGGYWYFGAPGENVDTMLFVGHTASPMRKYFADIQKLRTVSLDRNVLSINQGVSVWLCENPLVNPSRMWKELQGW
ncbi:MAG: glycosyltransferase [Pseudonocardiaceae bacterium]|nr:glycosyltransferase [Pseudonocardiaceae bacterium]